MPQNDKWTKYDGVDTYIKGLGTVRECIDCHAVVLGGPTRCSHCVKRYVRAANAIERTVVRAFYSLYWRSHTMRRIFR